MMFASQHLSYLSVLLRLALCMCAFGSSSAIARCVVHGGSDGTVIRAIIMRPAKLDRNAVWINRAGKIECVGLSCVATHKAARLVDCDREILTPAFINLHEHLAFESPSEDAIGSKYTNRQEWRFGSDGYQMLNVIKDMSALNVANGELRHLLSGTTSVVGRSSAPGFVRNLDANSLLSGLPNIKILNDTFPFGGEREVDSNVSCLRAEGRLTKNNVEAFQAVVAHVAEGTDDEAKSEVACLSGFAVTSSNRIVYNQRLNLINNRLAVVHGIALDSPILASMARHGASLIWSPRSNLTLYGKTANIGHAIASGVNIALGTDWLPTGSVTMPDEAMCAFLYARKHHVQLRWRNIWNMMTTNAAIAAHVNNYIGSIGIHKIADLILLHAVYNNPYQSVALVRPHDILLIMKGGRVVAGRKKMVLLFRNSKNDRCLSVSGELGGFLCVGGETSLSGRDVSREMARSLMNRKGNSEMERLVKTCSQ